VTQIDPWEKAAECVRAIQISTDPHQKDVLANLQQMWIALANQRDLLTQEEQSREAKNRQAPCHLWRQQEHTSSLIKPLLGFY
jgi:hypothetical protein